MGAAREGFDTLAGQEHNAEVEKAQIDSPGAANVDKIRDILFGSHMRDYDARFSRLEEALTRDIGDLRETTRRRVDSLEAYLKKEFESLDSRLKTERSERLDSGSQISRELKDAVDSITKKIHETEDQTVSAQADLRKGILQQSTELRDEMRTLENQISAAIEKRFHELRSGKTDRAALATLFNEVAMKLNGEFQLPKD